MKGSSKARTNMAAAQRETVMPLIEYITTLCRVTFVHRLGIRYHFMTHIAGEEGECG